MRFKKIYNFLNLLCAFILIFGCTEVAHSLMKGTVIYMKIIIAIIVFGVIIAVHEFGHFIVAKKCGIKVNEFAIGMGPAIFKKQKGETKYSLRIFPIGGFCAMEGEDADSTDERAFHNQTTIKKIAVLVAGAVMNILLGFVIILIMVSTGEKIGSSTIASFDKNATSSETGLKIDDKILKINGMKIFVDTDIIYQFTNDTDGIFKMEVLRDGEKIQLNNVKFVTKSATDISKQQIVIDFKIYSVDKTFLSVLDFSVKKTASVARLIWISLIDLLSGKYGFNELSGPVGIVNVIGTAMSQGQNFIENLRMVLNLTIFITINVGIFNLLPLPALDGGRIVFRIAEGITKKRLKPETEGMIHFIGLAALMLLMVVVTFNDISKLFIK